MDLNGKHIITKSHKEQVGVELILNTIGIYHVSGFFGYDPTVFEKEYYSIACLKILNNVYYYSDIKFRFIDKKSIISYEQFLELGL